MALIKWGRLADRWAAVGMMAGHPNSAKPFSLANTPFNIQMGGADSAFDRNKVAADWGQQLVDLATEYPGLYANHTTIHAGLPHWMDGLDSQALPWMHQYQRDALPTTVHWQQNNPLRQRFYWLSLPLDKALAKEPIKAHLDVADNAVHIEQNYSDELAIWLNDAMLDLSQPVKVYVQQQLVYEGIMTRKLSIIAQSLALRFDNKQRYSAAFTLTNNAEVTPL